MVSRLINKLFIHYSIMLFQLKQKLQQLANPEKAKQLQRFFKTGKGEYGEGDIFLGIIVPEQRKIAKQFQELSLNEIQKLLNSKIHEHRLIALLILIDKYKKASEYEKQDIFNFYLENTNNINNWDLVDLSAHKIIGDFLQEKRADILYELAKSKNLWEKRISIISTFAFIRNNQFEEALKISEILLNDSHDLIHKAVGWVLREIGKKNQNVEEEFLKKHYIQMPRTMLRYALEKLNPKRRQQYLKGKI